MSNEIGNIDWPAVITAAASSPLGIIALIVIALSIVGYLMLRGASEHYRFIAFLLLFFGGVALGASLISERDNFLAPLSTGVIATTGAILAEPKAVPVVRIEERTREVPFSDRNSHCASSRELNWRVNSAHDWEIDVTSIEVRVTVKSKQSQYIGVNNASNTGFNIVGRLINNGECVKVLGNTVAKDGRGALNVIAKFKETRAIEN